MRQLPVEVALAVGQCEKLQRKLAPFPLDKTTAIGYISIE